MDLKKIKNNKVLVTGGNGYLGENLIKKLILLNANIFSLDINKKSKFKNINYFQVDINDFDLLNKVINNIKPDYIFHLAAILDRSRSFKNYENVYKVNLFGTINLLMATKDLTIKKFIFMSTSEIYGGEKNLVPFKEESNCINPPSNYSISKLSAEKAIINYSKLFNKNYIILRLFNFYDQNTTKNFFINKLISKLKNNIDFDMTKGEQIRDFIHIDDVIESILRSALCFEKNEIINVCTGKGNSLKNIALLLKEKLGSKSKINFGYLPYRKNEIWEMVGDNQKLKKILKFVPSQNISID